MGMIKGHYGFFIRVCFIDVCWPSCCMLVLLIHLGLVYYYLLSGWVLALLMHASLFDASWP